MATAVELWTYANEAMRWSRLAGNERDRSALIELAHRWREAAYAARLREASNASLTSTKSVISQRRSVTPAAMAGDTLSA
jgi:hypothetical protein